MTDETKLPTEEEAEAQVAAERGAMAPMLNAMLNPMEAISREALRERERILNLIRAKHGRDFENTIRETIGLPRLY